MVAMGDQNFIATILPLTVLTSKVGKFLGLWLYLL
jgi:hypothetical protein